VKLAFFFSKSFTFKKEKSRPLGRAASLLKNKKQSFLKKKAKK
jgi:hypothetical protein